MPEGLLQTAMAGRKFDAEQNRLMVVYMRDQMAALRESDVKALECYHMLAWDPEPVIDTVLEAMDSEWSIECRSVHSPYGHLVDPSYPDPEIRKAMILGCEQTISFMKRLGARVMVVHPGANTNAPVDRCERMRLSVQAISEVADMAAAEGIKLAVEPMPKQEIGNTVDELLWIIDHIDRPNVGVCFDTNHVFPAASLPGEIRKIGGRLLNVHTSDHDGGGERHWLPFEGVVDWESIVKALMEVGFDGPVIYEAHGSCKGSCRETVAAIEKSYAKLEQVIEGLLVAE
jgi:sugar phosphate isomerase/epimerase